MLCIKGGFFNTSITDIGKTLSWWQRYLILKKSKAPKFLTLVQNRYLIELSWVNPVPGKYVFIEEDLMMKEFGNSWICVLEKTSDYVGTMSLGGHGRLLFKRPIMSLENCTRERDECIHYLKTFFSDIQVLTYQKGFEKSDFPEMPFFELHNQSHYVPQTLPYTSIVITCSFMSGLLAIALGLQLNELESLEYRAQSLKPEIAYFKKHYKENPILEIIQNLDIIRYFKARITSMDYNNGALFLHFQGPYHFENYLYPLLKKILHPYKTHVEKDVFVIKIM